MHLGNATNFNINQNRNRMCGSHCSVRSKGKREGKKLSLSEHLLCASLALGDEKGFGARTVKKGLFNNSSVRVGTFPDRIREKSPTGSVP